MPSPSAGTSPIVPDRAASPRRSPGRGVSTSLLSGRTGSKPLGSSQVRCPPAMSSSPSITQAIDAGQISVWHVVIGTAAAARVETQRTFAQNRNATIAQTALGERPGKRPRHHEEPPGGLQQSVCVSTLGDGSRLAPGSPRKRGASSATSHNQGAHSLRGWRRASRVFASAASIHFSADPLGALLIGETSSKPVRCARDGAPAQQSVWHHANSRSPAFSTA
ncbi:hypothetical protein FBZ93_111185 [Bradyrhizobium macuxiense]|uniref:Uncharacterized protein n=1 Tax=Bradyrhizobium macuxiense TaxID=1755647 RepID=A0A560LC45_9BRAD|nr:hypothetical protein FBZ93_111185 [Bradyrhizobium macuxiense]